jgi:hypothetical protein
MRMRLATGTSPRVAGWNFHWRIAVSAASSNAAPPDSITSGFVTDPSAATVRRTTTVAPFRAASASGG